jgi:hypothetical protein
MPHRVFAQLRDTNGLDVSVEIPAHRSPIA